VEHNRVELDLLRRQVASLEARKAASASQTGLLALDDSDSEKKKVQRLQKSLEAEKLKTMNLQKALDIERAQNRSLSENQNSAATTAAIGNVGPTLFGASTTPTVSVGPGYHQAAGLIGGGTRVGVVSPLSVSSAGVGIFAPRGHHQPVSVAAAADGSGGYLTSPLQTSGLSSLQSLVGGTAATTLSAYNNPLLLNGGSIVLQSTSAAVPHYTVHHQQAQPQDQVGADDEQQQQQDAEVRYVPTVSAAAVIRKPMIQSHLPPPRREAPALGDGVVDLNSAACMSPEFSSSSSSSLAAPSSSSSSSAPASVAARRKLLDDLRREFPRLTEASVEGLLRGLRESRGSRLTGLPMASVREMLRKAILADGGGGGDGGKARVEEDDDDEKEEEGENIRAKKKLK